MPIKRVRTRIGALLLTLLCTGCSFHQYEVNQLAASLQNSEPEQVLKKLEQIEPPERDYAQYQLNCGTLKLLSGDFSGAIDSLSRAKQEMAALEASSVTENVSAATINETLRSYSGTPTDRVMVHNLLALAYLMNNESDAARVEILQADVMMKKVSKSNSLIGQLASTHILSALIYELLGELNNAYVSYRLADEVMMARKLSTPEGLQNALLRLSRQMEDSSGYQQYSNRFNQKEVPAPSPQSNRVFVIYFDGLISSKFENSVTVPGNGQLVRVALPAYHQAPKRKIKHAQIKAGSNMATTGLIENLEPIVREDLSDEYPALLLAATSRAIAKYNVVHTAGKEDALLGLFMNVATLVTESADLRSWNMLPANIQYLDLSTDQSDITIAVPHQKEQTIQLNHDQQYLLLISSLTPNVYLYSTPK